MKHDRLPRLPFPTHPGGGSDAVEPGTLLGADRWTLLASPEPIDLRETFRCGQIFRWGEREGVWYGPYRQGSLSVRRTDAGTEVRALGVEVTAEEAWRFLGLDVSLHDVATWLRGDRHVAEAVEALAGLRILRQDPWECVAGYICSQWNNIPKIELTTGRMAEGWGTVHQWPEGARVASFPAPETLARLSPEALQGCALGYRCPYLIATAQRVAEGAVDLYALRESTYPEALRALLQLPGIGRKVADCILLFSLDKPQACPVDVWVRRVVHELYPRQLAAYLPDAATRAEKGLSGREYDAIVQFAWERWGMLAGYAQQYLFHARRTGRIGPRE